MLLLVAVIGGCAHQSPATTTADTFVRLERSKLFGAPPDYEVNLFADGVISYASQGEAHWDQVSPDEVRRLIEALEKLGDPTTWTCESTKVGNDYPGAVLTVSRQGVLVRVVHDHGNFCFPGGLWIREHAIDGVAQTARWRAPQ